VRPPPFDRMLRIPVSRSTSPRFSPASDLSPPSAGANYYSSRSTFLKAISRSFGIFHGQLRDRPHSSESATSKGTSSGRRGNSASRCCMMSVTTRTNLSHGRPWSDMGCQYSLRPRRTSDMIYLSFPGTKRRPQSVGQDGRINPRLRACKPQKQMTLSGLPPSETAPGRRSGEFVHSHP